MQLLKYGLNYSIERPASTYAANLIAETEKAMTFRHKNAEYIPRHGNKETKTSSVQPTSLTYY